jgi:hypothetical protein
MITLVEQKELPSCVVIGSTVAASHVGEINSYRFSVFFYFFFCFVHFPTGHDSQRISTYDGSKDVAWRKDVLFECPKCCDQFVEVQNPPKTAPVRKSQPKRKRPIKLNNFVNMWNTPIIVMNHR